MLGTPKGRTRRVVPMTPMLLAALKAPDAMTWTPHPLVSGSSENLRALWGTAPDNLFVIGDQGSLFHFD
ncbi:MAG: hypothetical protein ACXVDD_06910, partial [Polyangia bacterium]